MNISAKCSSHQPHVVLPVKLRCPVRKLTCVSRRTCLNKSGKRHSKLSMETGTTIKTAAVPPVCVMPAFSFNASAGNSLSNMYLVPLDPSRPTMNRMCELHPSNCSSPCSPALHTMCMLTTLPWKRGGFFEAVWQV